MKKLIYLASSILFLSLMMKTYFIYEAGPSGAPGFPGSNGLNGTGGADGENGLNGINGISGVDGINGQNGLNGINGQNGQNGVNGQNGQNGVNGVNGRNGPTPEEEPVYGFKLVTDTLYQVQSGESVTVNGIGGTYEFDVGNTFNPIDGTFSAPIDGVYFVSVNTYNPTQTYDGSTPPAPSISLTCLPLSEPQLIPYKFSPQYNPDTNSWLFIEGYENPFFTIPLEAGAVCSVSLAFGNAPGESISLNLRSLTFFMLSPYIPGV